MNKYQYRVFSIQRNNIKDANIKSKEDIAQEIEDLLNTYQNDILDYKLITQLDGDYLLLIQLNLLNETDIYEIISQVEKLHPYKVVGDADSYSDYNQGWSDACDTIEERIEDFVYNKLKQ